jgi:hypothetical protein
MDDQTRELLQAIHDAMENPSARQRFRIAAALEELLRDGSTATPGWAAEFIRRGPREEAMPSEQR